MEKKQRKTVSIVYLEYLFLAALSLFLFIAVLLNADVSKTSEIEINIWDNIELIATVIAVFGAGAVNFVAWRKEKLATDHKDEIAKLKGEFRELDETKDELARVINEFKDYEREIAIFFMSKPTVNFGDPLKLKHRTSRLQSVDAVKNRIREDIKEKLKGRDEDKYENFLKNTGLSKNKLNHVELKEIP